MEMYIAAGHCDRDPYWCEPWPSALAMAEQLLQRRELVAGRSVCELGCGLGLAGLAAAVAGAAEVVLLDREPLALQCALLNAALNGLTTAGGGGGVQPPSLEELLPHLQPDDVARLQEHQQGLEEQRRQQQQQQQEQQQGGAAAAGVVRAEVFDWSQPITLPPHDACLACDVLYEAFSVQASAGAGPLHALACPPCMHALISAHACAACANCLPTPTPHLQPVAEVAPKLLKREGSRLLLADPPDRARHNRCARRRRRALQAERRLPAPALAHTALLPPSLPGPAPQRVLPGHSVR